MKKTLSFDEFAEKSTSKIVDENYEMDVGGGEMATEHAKAVIDRAMENHKEQGKWNLSKALDQICEENDISDEDNERREMITSAIKEILEDLSKQVEDLHKKIIFNTD